MDLGADYVDEDFLFQPAPASVRAVPRFQPKTFSKSVKPVKGHPRTWKPVKVPSEVPVVAGQLVPPVLEASVHISDTMNTNEKPSLQIASTNDSLVDASESLISGGNVNTAQSDHGEGEGAIDLGTDSIVDDCLLPSDPHIKEASNFQPKLITRPKERTVKKVSFSISEKDTRLLESESLEGRAPIIPPYSFFDSATICDSTLTDLILEQPYHVDKYARQVASQENNHLVGKEQTSDLSKDTNKEVHSHDIERAEQILNEKSTSKVVEDEGASKSTRKSRKRVRKSTPDKVHENEQILNEKSTSKVVEDEGASKSTRKSRKRVRKYTPDKIHENQESDNSNIEVEGIHSDDGCGGKGAPKQKRARRTSKKPVTETEKPTRKRKKSSEELGSAEQESVKKFPHVTRRRRRQVNKELLLTPEEEINRSQLSIRDLIRTYEAKERMSKKEVSAGGNSSFNQRDNHFGTNGEFWGQEDDFENYDAQLNVTTTKWNHHSFRKNPTSTSRWSKEETDLFYQALRQFGTNFEIIQKLFPGRTRHQMTLKFKNERRKYPLQIAHATTHRSKDFSLVKLVIQALADEEKEKAKKTVYYVNVNNDEDEYEEGNEQPEKEEEAANDLEGEFDKEEQEANEWEGGGDEEEQDVSESHNQFEFEDTQWDGNASYYEDTETDEFSFLL